MNQVYRIVWNAATLTWVVAPEFAKGRKKSCKSSRTARLRTVVFALGILGGAAAHAAVIATPAQAQNGTYSGTSTTSASATGGDSTAVGAAATASAQGATAVGAAAKATNQNATAVGILAIASGQQSVALGWQATSSADYAMAFGGNASAAGIQSLALGTQASTTAAAKDAIALGTLSKASAANATALGTGANASGDYSMALGYNTSATGTAGVALGSTAQAVQQGVAVGSGANAAGVSSIALGLAAKAANSNGVAIGTSAQTGTGTSTAIGSSSKADAGTTTGAKSATAVGANAAATGDGALAQGDSATATGDKATAVGRGAQAIGGSTTALGAGATASTQAATALGAGAVASGVSSMAVGVAATAGGVNSLAMGLSAAAGGQSSLAIGNRASGGGQDSIAIGRVSSAGGQNSIAIGGGTPGTGNDSSSSYSGASAAGQDSIAVGRAALAGGQNSIAIGGSGSGQGATPGLASWASGEDGIALGRGAQSSDTRNIALGALSHAGFADGAANAPFSTVGNTINGKYYAYAGGTADSTVSVGNSVTKLYRTVTNVAAGRVSSSSTDAVNGSQLYAAYQAFGASVGDGTGSSDLADVVKYDDATHNSVTLGNTVSTDGGVTGGTRITNVAQGALSATSTDAVNGAQLYATNQNVADVSNTVNNINNGAGIKYFHANSTKDDSSATGNDAIAVGPKAIAAGNSAIAMGNGAQATSGSGKAIAIGDSAVANGGISIGETSKTADSQQIAIGPGATVKAGAGIALGALSSSTGTTDVAIGYLSQANGGQSIAMGTWASTASGANYAMAMGYQASASAERSVALGLTAKTTAAAQYGVAIGNASSASALGGVAVGSGAAASQDNGVAIGRQSTTLADLTQSAYNPNASATIAGATPFGEFSVGAAGKERRITNVAAGAAATDAVNVSQLQAAVGLSSADAVKYDDATHNSVTLSGTLSTDGGVTGGTKISNVAQAQLSATSTDAVNGAQLYATNQQVAENTTNITNLGNKVTTLADTPITFAGNSGSVARKLGETMSIQGEASTSGSYSGANLKTQVDSNGDLQLQMADNLALTSVTTGNTVINNNGLTINGGPSVTVDGINAGGQKISNVADGTADSDAATVGQVNAVASTITADAVKYDDASHNSVTLGNTVSTDGGVTGGTKISNVAQGELSATSTDAVNGSQLYATNQQVGENTTNITNLGDTVNNLGDSITNIAGDTSNTYVTNNGRGVKYARTNDTGLTSGDAHATVAGATALGYEATASHGNSVALGANALADGSTLNDEAYLVGGKAGGEVSVGAAGNTRRITNLAAGANDTDAVNVSQLKASVAGSVADAVMYDDASHNSITLGGTAYDSATGTGGTRISNVAKGTADSDAVNVAQLKDSGLIDSNGNAQKAVLFNGPNGEANVAGTKIVNVAAGDVTSTSTDAVNGSQLYATNQQVGENTTNITNLGNTVNNLGDSVTTLADTPITFAGNSGSVARKLGETMSIQGEASTSGSYSGANLKTAVDSNGNLQLQMADNLAVTSVTAGNTVINNSGLTINGGPSVTVDGIDAGGQKIVNVADGTDASDAATVGQVNAAASAAMADAVKYDDASHNSVTLGGTAYDSATGTGGTKVSNVAKGTADSDAVNVAQLKDSGLIDSNGNTLNAVTYDDATKGSITLGGTPYDSVTGTGGTKIGNVAKGTVDSDAVNVAQLKDSGLIDNNGNTLNAVTYDDATKGSVTLGGTPYDSATGTGGTKIGNVAKGTADSDAVNVSQLKDSGLIDGNGNTLNAVTYDDATKGSVTLGGTPYDSATGTGGTKISNVAKGTGDSDAVNVSQLKDAGLIDSNGNTLNAVTYDDATKRSVTLGGVGATTPVRLGNVADGTDDHDAVNVSQLRNSGLLDGNGNTLNAVTYDDATKGIVTLGGVGATTPVRLGNVADGNIAAGSRDAVNGGQIATLVSQINGLDNRVTNIEANGTGGGSSLPYVDGNANGSSSNNADAGSTAGVAVGYNAKATGENASVLGQNATALGSYGTAIGNDSYAAGPNDTALGGNAKVHADGSVAVGANATVTSAAATNAVAVGADTQVSAASGTAIGQGASVAAAATGGVALGQGSVADRANTVSVGTATNQRQITNVAAGSQATDAVNVDQLTSVVNGLGGGASIDSTTGAVTGPSYQLSDGTYSNVGDALSSLDNRVNAANQAIGDLSRNAYSGIAAATALTMIPDVDKDKKLSLGIGAGSYKGYHAFAIGGTARITQNIKMRAGLGRSGSGTTAGVGASYQW